MFEFLFLNNNTAPKRISNNPNHTLPKYNSDAILREEIAQAGLADSIWQYFTVFPNVRTVGAMGDGRTYDNLIAIRAVTSVDAMTVEVAEIPYPLLQKITLRIINEVKGINRVVYDITPKPPATIEWE